MRYFKLKFFIFFLFFNTYLSSAQSSYIDSLYADAQKAFSNNDYSKNLDNSLRVLRIAEKSNECKPIIIAHYKVASAYYHVKLRNKTYEHLKLALRKSEECDKDSLKATVLRLLGSMYCEDLKTDSALNYLKNAETILNKTKNWRELSMLSSIIGETYFESNYPKIEAEKYIEQAVKYGEMSNDKNTLAFSLIKLGRLKTFQKRFEEAEECFLKSKKLYNEISVSEGEVYALSELALSKSKAINNNEIYDIMKQVEKLRDSIFKIETAEKTARYKTLYETEKKESDLKIKTVELEKQKETNNYIIISAIFLFIVLIILFMLFVVRFKNKKRIEAIETKERERHRIARELHDNIGSNMSYIISKLNNIETNDNNQKKLIEIKDIATEVIGNIRETLWTLNTKKISNVDLFDKLKVYTKNRLLVKCKISESVNNEFLLSNEVVLSLYRCSQEIINNINKHSKADLVNINFTTKEFSKIMIEFIDNGVGFDNVEKEDSYGLRNIKSRLNEINAKLELYSETGHGTTIRIIYN